MSPEAFTQIMSPLQEKYPKHFVPETMKPIYRIMGHLTIDQARHVVGSLILRHRFAPLEQDFKDAVADLFRPKQFIQHEEEARVGTVFSEDENKENFKFIQRVIAGRVSKEELESTVAALNAAIEVRKKK